MAKSRAAKKRAVSASRPRPNFPPKLHIPKGTEVRDVSPAAIPEPHHMRDEERSYRTYEDKK